MDRTRLDGKECLLHIFLFILVVVDKTKACWSGGLKGAADV